MNHSQELEPPPNPGQFSATLICALTSTAPNIRRRPCEMVPRVVPATTIPIGSDITLEFDIHGKMKSTHIGRTQMMDGIGDSADSCTQCSMRDVHKQVDREARS